MRKTILTILGSALLAASTAQFAAASERHMTRADNAMTRNQFRNTNDSYRDADAWRSPTNDAWRYQDFQAGAPAGR
jgi:hypothetical protein